MRMLLILAALVIAVAAHAQLVNGDFEQAVTTDKAPAGWQLQTKLLPDKWGYNAQCGGPVGLVEDAHGGKYAVRFAADKSTAHLLGATFPVQTGDVYELSAWAKGGAVDLTFYEYGAGQKWLRTAAAATTVRAGAQWRQGGGFHLVTDPQVTQITVVLSTGQAGVTVDDVALRKVERTRMNGPDVVLENQGCRLTLAADGSVKSCFDKTLNAERVAGTPRPFMRAQTGAWNLPASGVSKSGDMLTVTFGDKQAQARVQWQPQPLFMGFVLKAVEPADLQAITLFDLQVAKLPTIAGTIAATYDDAAIECLQTLNFDGQQVLRQADADNVNFVCTYPDLSRKLYGPSPVRGCALITCPRPQFASVMQQVEKTYGLPSPQLGGKPGKLSRVMKQSYLFICDLTEDNVDEVIGYAKRGHFGYVLIVEHDWSHGSGSFIINEKNFPHGPAGLKATIAKIQKAGFPVGLHMLTAGISVGDPLVTPVPDNGIYVDMQAELAGDVDEQATFIPTKEPPDKFPTEDGGYRGTGTILRIGDEMVQYSSIKLDPPYGFGGCKRGWNKSQAAPHQAGAAVKHLYRAYGLFLMDTHTDLIDRVADNVARTWNYCNCDGIYFDGSEWLQGDHAYYNARLQMAYYERFKKKDIIAQGSSFSPYSWHLLSRSASADGFRDIKLYLAKRTPGFQWLFSNFMPLDIGWYGINPNIRPDDIEYVCSRSVAFDSSVSVETTTQALRTVPQALEMIDTIARWEDLRLSGRVPVEVRKQMQSPDQEWRLSKVQGKDALVPVRYTDFGSIPAQKRLVHDDRENTTEVDMPAVLQVQNERKTPAQTELQLEAGPVVKPGPQYAQGQPLELFEQALPGDSKALDTHLYNPATDGSRATSQGVTQEVKLITDDVKEGRSACSFKATSTLPSATGWATFGRRFDPPLELENYEYLGLWVKGDGKGEALKVQLWDAAGTPQDQYIAINWTGWRFIELRRPDPAKLDYTRIVSLNFYYNSMPANTTSHCLLDGLKVLSAATATANPTLIVNGERVTFPVQMSGGDRLVMRSPADCWLYPAGKEKVRVTPQGNPPVGAQEISVTVDEQTVANQMLFRAALHWPGEAIIIPAK